MTIELSPGQSPYQYRIHATDKRVIERRLNKSGARWSWYARRDTPQEAKRAILKMQNEDARSMSE